MTDSAFRLRYMGDPVLSTPCKPLLSVADIPDLLVPFMETIIARHNGAGLAAPQVGVSLQIAIIKVDKKPTVIINPRILSHSQAMERGTEGCLSVPGFWTPMMRYTNITIEYVDEQFRTKGACLTGFEARCAQHELDHLAGRNITDGLPRQQRRAAERCVAKVA
jgi:peptide deformylase